jgi:membrane fusion protein (multidrug efflux system)
MMLQAVRSKAAGASTPLALATGLLAALLLVAGCSKQDSRLAAAASVPLAVRVFRVEPRPLEVSLNISGSLVSSVAVDVKTEFAGRIASMLKAEGDRVCHGELLAQLEDVSARLSVAQARANLEVAQAALDRAKVGETHTRMELERAQNLLKSGGITDQGFQAAQMSANDLHAQVKLAEAQVDQAKQALALAEKHLSDTRIVSPIIGEVERKYFNPGTWVDGNILLYRLVDNQRLELQTFVASSDLAPVAKGETIHFHVAAYPDEVFEARILTLSAAVDAQNRSVLVRATAPNPTGKLRAGMFVKGDIVTGTKPAALLLPPAAIWRRIGQPPFVFVVEQNRARRREVRTGLEQPQGTEIASGVNSGDLVVIEQNLELADGVSVTPRL